LVSRLERIRAVLDTRSALTTLRAAALPALAAAELATARTLVILAVMAAAPVLADGTAVAMHAHLLTENAAMVVTTAGLASIAASTTARRSAVPRLVALESLILGVWEALSRAVLL
jgi:hypothetical protein